MAKPSYFQCCFCTNYYTKKASNVLRHASLVLGIEFVDEVTKKKVSGNDSACPVCKSIFGLPHEYQKHIINMHRVSEDSVAQTDLQCFRCALNLSVYKEFQDHVFHCTRPPKRRRHSDEEDDSEGEALADCDEADENGFNLTINGVDIRSRVTRWCGSVANISDKMIHKIDLLMYHIFDFSASSATHGKVLLASEWDDIRQAMSAQSTTRTNIGDISLMKYFIRETLKGVYDVEEMLSIMAEAPAAARRGQGPLTHKKTKILLRLAEIFCEQCRHGRNRILQLQPEWNYTSTFLVPIIDTLFKDVSVLEFMWGEGCLKSVGQATNLEQSDATRRSAGPKIDAIISSTVLGCEMGLVEVSGAPASASHTHYIGDRNKIAINLKILLNTIRTNHNGSNEHFRRIKLIGIQVYSNHLYIYSMSRPYNGLYAFVLEASFELSSIPYVFHKKLPGCIAHLMKMKLALEESLKTILEYVESEAAAGSLDSSLISHTSLE